MAMLTEGSLEEGFRFTFQAPDATDVLILAGSEALEAAIYPGIERLPFITKQSDTLHLDLNSCFASIEQQCNSLLRGRPVAVAAYASPRGCILSPSVEAKRFGIKTGMRVMEGKKLCPDLVVLPPDPWKYRWVNQKMQALLLHYTPHMEMKSIDEAVLHFDQNSSSQSSVVGCQPANGAPRTENRDLEEIAFDIKAGIKREIGDWLTISVGIGPNRWLAKMAAGLHKPDGLDELQWWNIESVLEGMKLEDLHGISRGLSGRLRQAGLLVPMDVYKADIPALRLAFKSILGWQWHLKMRGYEVDDKPYTRKSFSHMYSLPRPAMNEDELGEALSKLIHSLGYRLRRSGYRAQGVYVGVSDEYWVGWHRHKLLPIPLYDTADLYRVMMGLVAERPDFKPVRKVFVGVFNLVKTDQLQTTLLHDEVKKRQLVAAVDRVHALFGKESLMPARMLRVHRKGWAKDFVAFGGVKELEEFDFEEEVEVEDEMAVLSE